ncbi:hypothetical protein SAMN05428977_10012 [Nitrosomonas sp. Nm166]|nr:hypothetical protein SAMN05428977_10012 [Nitrosomonas sp. Nm166]
MKHKSDNLTIDIFDDLPPKPIVVTGGLPCRAKIAHVMSDALKIRDRYRVVASINRLLGRKVKLSHFNNFTSESRSDSIPPLDVAIAFDLAAGSSALGKFYARKIAAKMVFGKEALDAKLGHLERIRDEATKEIKWLKRVIGELQAITKAYDMSQQAAKAQLEQSGRPLVTDEFDYVVDKNLVKAIGSFYEENHAVILIISEENFPQELEVWAHFHGRILNWYPAEPAVLAVSVADDLLERLVEKTRGNVRRICTNLETIQGESLGMGWKIVDLATWKNRRSTLAKRQGRDDG